MKQKGFGLQYRAIGLTVLIFLSGCAGSGAVVKLDVRALPSTQVALQAGKEPQNLTIFVMPFEDQRSRRDRVGVRTHFWGGVTQFDVEGSNAGETVARVLADYLKQRGFTVGMGTPGVAGVEGKPDVILTGRVLEFAGNAKSRFGNTLIMTSLKLALKAENTTDDSVTGMTMDDRREETVFSFEQEDLEELANKMLRESIEKLLQDMKVAQGKVQLG